MSRKKMDLRMVPVRLDRDIPGRIDAIAGKQHRSEFIREALRKEVEARENDSARRANGEKSGQDSRS